jgi:K+/H+ antiporter YhaU regulatory subunit KhtT
MKHFLDNKFSGLRDAIYRNRQEKDLRRSRTAEVFNTVENVVDGTDSKIRLVPGYKKKLQNIIQSSLEFADDLVDQIPEAIEVSGRTFASDPYVNAFFTNVTDLQSIICHSSEIHDYMEDTRDDNGSCCALLCMKRTEKTVMGMEVSGSMLKRDVLQVAVSFSDHRIYSPALSEPETREGLKTCLFQGLTTNALERIAKLQLASHRLQGQRQMLQARLRRYRQKAREVAQDTRTASKIAQAIEETSQELGKTEKQMLHSPLLTPQVALEQVTDVFSKPGDFIRIRRFPLSLNKMGIKISDDSPQPANKLNLTEVIIGNELPRVVTLATFPRKELATGAVFSVPG